MDNGSLPTPVVPAPSTVEMDLTGRSLGDFHLLRRLGTGGMGQVYLAEQVSLKRKVALKLLRADLASNPVSLARFKAEAEAIARATHANIVQVYFIGEENGLPYMALEYVEGRNLRDHVARKGPVDLLLGLSVLRQSAAALQRAAELNIIHRDIKPENILLTPKGEVKVADFGLSRCLAGDQQSLRLTQSGVTMGTPLYMSPEQVEGKAVDSRSDIYSLGITCYHMFAGEPPFRGETAIEVALKHVREEPTPLSALRPDLPEAVSGIVHKMMAKEPAHRYQTPRELLRDVVGLRETLSGQTMVLSLAPSTENATQPPTPVQTAPRPRRWWVLPLLFGGSVTGAAAAGAILAWQQRPAAPVLPAAPGDVAELEALFSLPKREQALRMAVEPFLTPENGSTYPNPQQGIDRALALALFYLRHDRLDDAERYFLRLYNLPNIQGTRGYRLLGCLGRAITWGLWSQPKDSNKYFEEGFKLLPAREPAMPRRIETILLQHPELRYWLNEAMYYDAKNGQAVATVPQWVKNVWDRPSKP